MRRSTSFSPSSNKGKTPLLKRSVSFGIETSRSESIGMESSSKKTNITANQKSDLNDSFETMKETNVDKDDVLSIPHFSLQSELLKADKLSQYGRKLLDLHDKDPYIFFELDPDQFIKELKNLDPHHWDPLPINITWAWAEVDKRKNGIASRRDMYRLMKKYNIVVESSIDVMKLIKKCDRNNDKILDTSEIHEVLMLATGKEVTASDSTWVMARLEAMAKASTHGGYDSTMTSDPLIVSRAVFEWWWLRQDNRGAFYRRIQEGRQNSRNKSNAGLSSAKGTALPPSPDVDRACAARKREAELAARVLQVDVDALNMDCICFDDMVASRKSAMTLDLGLALLKSVEDKVQKACLPLGQGLVEGCTMRR